MAEAKVGKATGAAIVLGFSGGASRDQVPGVVWCTVAKARRYVREHNFAIRVDFSIGRAW